ncbi:MAG: isoamylase early set domain-containing protein [Caldilineaceae bacterium]
MCIRFELPSYLWAAQVYLVGDFNEWQQPGIPLCQDRDGVWRVELDLPRGQRFEFRYLVDNRWLTDCHSDGVTTNPFGTQNSIVQTDLPVAALRLGNGSGTMVPAPDPRRTHLTRME